LQSLQGNPGFRALTLRQQDLLLLQLCSFAFPGPGFGAVGINHGVKFCRYSSSLPTQLPKSCYWLVGRSRLQLGAEAVVLQGADLADLPACRPGGPFADRQLQEHPNLYADMSGHVVVDVLNRDRKYAREFLIRNQDKILWATDEGWWSFGNKDRQMNRHYTFLEELDLPDEVRHKIYRGNSEKVYGLK
jgi:hypothetical protein